MGLGWYYIYKAIESSSRSSSKKRSSSTPKKSSFPQNSSSSKRHLEWWQYEMDEKFKKAIENNDLEYVKSISSHENQDYIHAYFKYALENNASREILICLYEKCHTLRFTSHTGKDTLWDIYKEKFIALEEDSFLDLYKIMHTTFEKEFRINRDTDKIKKDILYIVEKKGIEFIDKLIENDTFTIDECARVLASDYRNNNENNLELMERILQRVNKQTIEKVVKVAGESLNVELFPLLIKYIPENTNNILLESLMRISNVSQKEFFTKELFKKLYECASDESRDKAFRYMLNGNIDLIQLFFDNGFTFKNGSAVYAYDFFQLAPKEYQIKAIEDGLSPNLDCAGNPLYRAIQNKDEEFIEYLLSKGADVNYDNGQLLRNAIWGKDIDVFKRIIQLGANVNCDYYEKDSIISHVVNENMYEFAKILVENGADLSRPANFHDYKISPLAIAIKNENFDIIKLLIDAGADLSQGDSRGKTIYQYARDVEDKEIRKYVKRTVIKEKINAVKTKIKSLFTKKDDQIEENNNRT